MPGDECRIQIKPKPVLSCLEGPDISAPKYPALRRTSEPAWGDNLNSSARRSDNNAIPSNATVSHLHDLCSSACIFGNHSFAAPNLWPEIPVDNPGTRPMHDQVDSAF
jgi:hypothetical protein